MSDSTELPIDLRPDHMELVRNVLKSYVPGREVRAYGSRAKWSAHDNSDLDLVVMSDSYLDSAVIGSLRGAFEESNLPFRVDVFDWNALPENFHTEIEREFSVIARESTCPGWSESSIREYAWLNYGKALPSRSRNANGKYPVYGSNGIIGYHDKALTEAPTVIVGRKGTAGAVHFSPTPCWPIDTTFYHEEEDTELALFKSYVLSTLGLDLMNSDSAVPGLNRDAAHAVRIQVPPSSEQRRIATVLGAIDRKIALSRKMRETLEQLAQAVFKSWFVDFEPVRAKIDGRWQEGDSLPGLPAQFHGIFPEHLVDSEIGPIPVGWQVDELGSILQLSYGKALPASKRIPGPVPVYGSNGRVGWHSEKYVDGPGIVVGRKGKPGTVVRIHDDFYPIDTTYYVEVSDDRLTLEFLYYALSLQGLALIGADSAVPGLNRELAYMSRQLIPTKATVDVFSAYVSCLWKRSHTLDQNGMQLAHVRDALLPKLISGEVRLPDIAVVTEC